MTSFTHCHVTALYRQCLTELESEDDVIAKAVVWTIKRQFNGEFLAASEHQLGIGRFKGGAQIGGDSGAVEWRRDIM